MGAYSYTDHNASMYGPDAHSKYMPPVIMPDTSFSFVMMPNDDGPYKRFATDYGLTQDEVIAFVHANDAGATFEELAAVLEETPIPHSKEMTSQRRKDEMDLIRRLHELQKRARRRTNGKMFAGLNDALNAVAAQVIGPFGLASSLNHQASASASLCAFASASADSGGPKPMHKEYPVLAAVGFAFPDGKIPGWFIQGFP